MNWAFLIRVSINEGETEKIEYIKIKKQCVRLKLLKFIMQNNVWMQFKEREEKPRTIS